MTPVRVLLSSNFSRSHILSVLSIAPVANSVFEIIFEHVTASEWPSSVLSKFYCNKQFKKINKYLQIYIFNIPVVLTSPLCSRFARFFELTSSDSDPNVEKSFQIFIFLSCPAEISVFLSTVVRVSIDPW